MCGSLTLDEHSGDVSETVSHVLKLLEMPKEVLAADWKDLGNELGKLGITTLHGTSLLREEDEE